MANSNPTKIAWLGFGLALLPLAPLVRGQLPPPPMPPTPPAGSVAYEEFPPAPSSPAVAVPPVSQPPPPLVIPEGLTPENRDPFWPVGYRPKSRDDIERERNQSSNPRNPAASPLWEEAQSSLRIGGSMRTQRGFTALINGELVKAGDIVSLRFKDNQYRWTVDSIALTGISLSRLDVRSIEELPKNPGKDRP